MTVVARPGGVEPALHSELPGLRIWEVTVTLSGDRGRRRLKEQLRLLSSRYRGAQAIALRSQPVPHAYRVLFRHIGLDPDARATPIEQAVLDRLKRGGFRSRSLVDDALLVALVETGVPVWALDEDAVEGELRLRLGRREDAAVPEGRLAVADDLRAVAELFGPIAPDAVVTRATARARLYAVAPAGVPAIHAEEALEQAATAIADGGTLDA